MVSLSEWKCALQYILRRTRTLYKLLVFKRNKPLVLPESPVYGKEQIPVLQSHPVGVAVFPVTTADYVPRIANQIDNIQIRIDID